MGSFSIGSIPIHSPSFYKYNTIVLPGASGSYELKYLLKNNFIFESALLSRNKIKQQINSDLQPGIIYDWAKINICYSRRVLKVKGKEICLKAGYTYNMMILKNPRYIYAKNRSLMFGINSDYLAYFGKSELQERRAVYRFYLNVTPFIDFEQKRNLDYWVFNFGFSFGLTDFKKV